MIVIVSALVVIALLLPVPVSVSVIVSTLLSTVIVSVRVRVVRAVARHPVVRVSVRALTVVLHLWLLFHHRLTLVRDLARHSRRQRVRRRLAPARRHDHLDARPVARASRRHVPRDAVDRDRASRRERRRHHVQVTRLGRYQDVVLASRRVGRVKFRVQTRFEFDETSRGWIVEIDGGVVERTTRVDA